MRLGIIGGGTVGHATARAFIEHVDEVRVYDVRPERRTHELLAACACDVVMVCLPTPQKEGSLECDLSAVEDFFGLIGRNLRGEPINWVLRSTVPVGTTRRLREQHGLPNLVHSPEFLTARCSVLDAQMPARNVIGYQPGDQASMAARDRLAGLYQARWPHVPIHVMSSDESEAVKLVQNSFFACKVAFWNEMRTLADRLELDWDRVIQAVLADGRISPSHTRVPGPDGRFGFGGECLIKDTSSLVYQLRQLGLDDAVTGGALERNRYDRERQP